MKIQKRLIIVDAILFFLMALAMVPTPAAATTCESLATLKLPDTTITLAQSVPAGPFVPPGSTAPINLPAFCRVVGVVTPAINFEVWMPAAGWNGKFQGVGVGGYVGYISYPAMGTALNSSYATACTDSGHKTTPPGESWALGHPELVVDLGFRAIHEMTIKAKAIVEAFYGAKPLYSYYTGCSGGGRQGLMEVQRYPGDYDGILAGDSAQFSPHNTALQLWCASATLKDPASYIPTSKLPLIHNAVLAACDHLDGVVDGVLDDPRRCNFNPSTLLCRHREDPATCLTEAQVEAVKKIYAGPHNPCTGEVILPGYMPGSELNWSSLIAGPLPPSTATGEYAYMVFEDPKWDWRTMDFDYDVAFADSKLGWIQTAMQPNLAAFEARGGKIIAYHGWFDASVTPMLAVNYYESVAAAMYSECGDHKKTCTSRPTGTALQETQKFFRLFMVPGMGHCSGGPGTDTFDGLHALEQWVEHGVAPDRIIASHLTSGVVDRTRPLCPYPQEETYIGYGSIDDAANFVCGLKSLDRADEASGFDH